MKQKKIEKKYELTQFNDVNGYKIVKQHKGNKLKTEQARKLAYYLLIKGYNNQHIYEQLMNTFGYKKDNCIIIVNKILNSLVIQEQNEIDELKTKYLYMFLDLYQKAVEKDDIRTANEVLKSIMKLQGLDVQKVEGTITNVFEVKF